MYAMDVIKLFVIFFICQLYFKGTKHIYMK